MCSAIPSGQSRLRAAPSQLANASHMPTICFRVFPREAPAKAFSATTGWALTKAAPQDGASAAANKRFSHLTTSRPSFSVSTAAPVPERMPRRNVGATLFMGGGRRGSPRGLGNVPPVRGSTPAVPTGRLSPQSLRRPLGRDPEQVRDRSGGVGPKKRSHHAFRVQTQGVHLLLEVGSYKIAQMHGEALSHKVHGFPTRAQQMRGPRRALKMPGPQHAAFHGHARACRIRHAPCMYVM